LRVRILITGGAGFIGSHLADRFLADGHTVIAVDNLLTGSKLNIAHLQGESRFQFIEHDANESMPPVEDKLDAVMHFASPASPIDYLKFPIETLKVGSYATINALELAKAKQARFMLASTSEIYGDPLVHPQTEDYYGNVDSIGPRSVYDEAKRFAESATMAFHRTHKIDTRIVRIFNTYGPRMRLDDGRVVPNFVGQALRGQPLTVYGDGKQTRSFCFVEDEVDGLVKLLNSDENLPVNIGNPHEMTIIQFAELINEITGNQAGIVYEDKRIQGDPQTRQPDISKAKKLLGWEPRIDIREGLERTIGYFRERV
jgi:dTDP-glucose 4,6-dehydratase